MTLTPRSRSADYFDLEWSGNIVYCPNTPGAAAFFIGNTGVTNGAGSGGDSVATGRQTTTLQIGIQYFLGLVLVESNCFCGGSTVTLENLPECVSTSFLAHSGQTIATGFTGEQTDGPCDDFRDLDYWSLLLTKPIPSIEFDGCQGEGGSTLPANGFSTIGAYLSPPGALGTNVQWSIESPTLGATVITNLTNGALIKAGTNSGTITVKACATNCCVTATLTLVGDEDELGCDSCPGGESGHQPNWSAYGPEGGYAAEYAMTHGSGWPRLGSIDVVMNLGRTDRGRGAGALRYRVVDTNDLTYSPSNLVFHYKARNVFAVTNDTGAIRQIKTPQGLADVITPGTNGFTVNFFRGTNVGIRRGLTFETNGIPFTQWVFENPNPGTTNSLRVTEQPAGQDPIVHLYTWITNGWQLDSASGLRVRTRMVEWITNAGVYRIETSSVRENSGTVVYQHARKFLVETPDEALLEEWWGTGANAKTNRYAWNTLAAYQPHFIVRADGSWDQYAYDAYGRVTTNFSAYLNQPRTNDPALCRTIVYDYSPASVADCGDDGSVNPFGPRKITEYVKNHPVSLRYKVHLFGETRDIVCLSTNAACTNSENLVTITRVWTNELCRGQIKSVEHPNGTMDLYYYDWGVNRTNIVLSGVPDGYKTNITDGTKSISVRGPLGQMISATTIDIASTITNSHVVYSDPDAHDRPRKGTHLDGTFEYTDYSCCGQLNHTNREGTVTLSTHDALKRLVSSTTQTPAGWLTHSNYYDAAGNILRVTRTGADGSTVTNRSATYDLAGRVTATKDAFNVETTYSETIAPVVRTTTYPDTGTRIETHLRDGALASLTGTAVFGLQHTNGIENGQYFTQETKLNTNGALTGEWVKHFEDLAGRPVRTLHPDNAASYTYYNARGQMTNQVDPDGVSTLYLYNDEGEVEYTVLDVNRDGTVDWAGPDRITRTVTTYLGNGSANVRQTKTWIWPENSQTSNDVSIIEASVDGRTNWITSHGLTTRQETTFVTTNGQRTMLVFPAVGVPSTNVYLHGLLLSASRGILGSTTNSYDTHARLSLVTDARTGSSTNSYNAADQLTAAATPVPASGQASQVTSLQFDSMGRLTNTLHPDGLSTTNHYFVTGLPKKTSGARTYPVAYTHDHAGRMKTMTTWTDAASGAGSAVTTWNYDGARGWLTNKVYADGKGPSYTNTPAGRLAFRKWARGTNTLYTYNNAGEPSGVDYVDPATPDVTYVYDRLGRQTTNIQGSITTTRAYDTPGNLLSESYSGGPLHGVGSPGTELEFAL